MTRERRLDNSEWPNWLHNAWGKRLVKPGSVFCASDGCLDTETHTPLFLQTRRGIVQIDWGDWIVQGVSGELHRYKPDIFEATYEDVATPPTHRQ